MNHAGHVGRREARKRAVANQLRVAAVRLIGERGYEATSTTDIALAAGVSQRTFFNHFPTKEAVVLLPNDVLAGIVAHHLRSRPLGEDIPRSLAAASMQTARSIAALPVAADDPAGQRELLIATIRLAYSEPAVRQVFMERRAAIEDISWLILQERGVAADDDAARAAVATVVALTYLAMRSWAEAGATESLPAVFARFLLSTPNPARFAAGITDDPAA